MATDAWRTEGEALSQRIADLAATGAVPRAVVAGILDGLTQLLAQTAGWLRAAAAKNEELTSEVERLRAEVQRGRDAAEGAIEAIERLEKWHSERVRSVSEN